MWASILALSGLAAAIGFAIVNNSTSRTGALVYAFAAGALLTMIADEMAPEAYERASIYAGLATVAGFALAVFLTSLALPGKTRYDSQRTRRGRLRAVTPHRSRTLRHNARFGECSGSALLEGFGRSWIRRLWTSRSAAIGIAM